MAAISLKLPDELLATSGRGAGALGMKVNRESSRIERAPDA